MLIWVMPPAMIAGTASTQKRLTSASRRGSRMRGTMPVRRMAHQTSASCAMPPSMVAIATQNAVSGASSVRMARGIRAPIVTRLRTIGAKAAAKNLPMELRIAA